MLIVIALILCISAYTQAGVATLFQAYYDKDNFDTNNPTAVWKSTESIMVWNKDFAWEDKIVYTRTGGRQYEDIDGDGRIEIIVVDTYLTDAGITYKFMIIDGTLVMVSTESQLGEPMYFVGHVRSDLVMKPTIRNGEWSFASR